MMRRRTLLLLAFGAIPLFACSESEADMSDKPSTNIPMLEKFIKLDPKPEAVEWAVMEEAEGSGLGPTDSAIAALLTYSAADYAKIDKGLSGTGQAEGGLMRRVPKWLPELVTAKSVGAADGAIDFGAGAIPAELFASSPYGDGFAVRFAEQRKVLVYLYSK